jgi:hypothetical protein
MVMGAVMKACKKELGEVTYYGDNIEIEGYIHYILWGFDSIWKNKNNRIITIITITEYSIELTSLIYIGTIVSAYNDKVDTIQLK